VTGSPVSAFVFYDENGNGSIDPGEDVRLPGVTVAIGSRTGQTARGGDVVVGNVPAGAQTAAIRAESLPPYFAPGAAVPVQVPQAAGSTIPVPAVLDIGSNRVRVYLAFGDSISTGDGSNDGTGYRSYLEANLRSYWGSTHRVPSEGVSGTKSNSGANRIGSSLSRVRPAYTLILYGTNDWNDLSCKVDFPCFTIESLRSMIVQVKDARSRPIVGTIIPGNPAYGDRVPPERQDWIKRMNDLIRPMAVQEGAVVADLYAVFMREPDLKSLFTDHVHPNDDGYAIMAREWARAITQPSLAGAALLDTLAPFFDEPFGTGPTFGPREPRPAYHSHKRR
jgi:lysophospholipase L1-like esterase